MCVREEGGCRGQAERQGSSLRMMRALLLCLQAEGHTEHQDR